MKILDRYIAKNFLIGYAISFCVLIGLRIIIDLFVNLDEFTEQADLGTWMVVKNVFTFYALNTTLYFRDIAGVIAVVAAAFSLGKMVRTNELVAIIASGVSAQRIVGPLLVLAALFTAVAVADQEFLIPAFRDKLVRDHDDPNGTKAYALWFLTDGNGSLICSPRYTAETATMNQPTIITRRRTAPPGIVWEVTGRISAESATYNEQTGQWDLVNGVFLSADPMSSLVSRPSSLASDASGLHASDERQAMRADSGGRPMASYNAGDLLPRDIPVRRNAGYDSLLSWWQLNELARQGTKIKDVAQLSSQKHFRITDPIINLTMLMVSLPVLICRDPKAMKSAIFVSFALTSACFVTTFVCKMLATEVAWIAPELWAWLPLFIFVTIAIIELDSMKT